MKGKNRKPTIFYFITMVEWHITYIIMCYIYLQKHSQFKRYHHRKFSGITNKSIIGVTNSTQHNAIATTSTSTTINSIYEYSEEKQFEAECDFQHRREHLWQICPKYEFIEHYKPNAWEFFISSGHSIAWCNVFKAASSVWMYYFNILGKCFCYLYQGVDIEKIDIWWSTLILICMNENNKFVAFVASIIAK